MNKKKILVVAMSLAIVAILAIGGTIAYFTDAEQKTNTMTIGNVTINIDEWQYDNGWENYVDKEFVLYPLENEQGAYLYNKSVRTYNTSASKDDVYMRSIVLIEKNDKLPADFVNEGGDDCFPGIHVAYDIVDAAGNYTYTSSKDGRTHHTSKEAGHLEEAVTINGKSYWVIWYVEAEGNPIKHNEALSSLHSVWLDKNITAEQAKNWGEDGVQVLVFSQAVQAKGLNHDEAMKALGEVNTTNLTKWIAGDDENTAARQALINDMPANN